MNRVVSLLQDAQLCRYTMQQHEGIESGRQYGLYTRTSVLQQGRNTALPKPTTVPQPSPFLNFLLEVCCCAQPWSRREHFTEAWVLEQVVILQPVHRSRSGVECVCFGCPGYCAPVAGALLHPDTELLVWNMALVANGSMPSSPADGVLPVFGSCHFSDRQRCPVYPVPSCVCLCILLWDGRENLVLW